MEERCAGENSLEVFEKKFKNEILNISPALFL